MTNLEWLKTPEGREYANEDVADCLFCIKKDNDYEDCGQEPCILNMIEWLEQEHNTSGIERSK